MNLIPVSSLLDDNYVNLFGIFFFEGYYGLRKLQESVNEAVKTIPHLSSVIVEEDRKHCFRIITPSNIIVKEKFDIEENLHDMYVPGKCGILDIKDGIILNSKRYGEKIEVTKNVRKPVLNVPLVKVSLVHTIFKKSLIFVSFNHCLADDTGLAYFMNLLADVGERRIYEFDFDRTPFSSPDLSFDLFKTNNSDHFNHLSRLKEIHYNKEVLDGWKGFNIFNYKEASTLQLKSYI